MDSVSAWVWFLRASQNWHSLCGEPTEQDQPRHHEMHINGSLRNSDPWLGQLSSPLSPERSFDGTGFRVKRPINTVRLGGQLRGLPIVFPSLVNEMVYPARGSRGTLPCLTGTTSNGSVT